MGYVLYFFPSKSGNTIPNTTLFSAGMPMKGETYLPLFPNAKIHHENEYT